MPTKRKKRPLARPVVTPQLIEAWRDHDRATVERLLAQPPWEPSIYDVGGEPPDWFYESDKPDWYRLSALHHELDRLASMPSGGEPL
jgi:hypothetical protein